MRRIFLMLFLFTAFSGSLFSSESIHQSLDIDYSTLNCVGDRIYFTSDHFILSDEGIGLLLQDCDGIEVMVGISQVNFDDAGIFILAEQLDRATGTCRNKHPIWHKECGGCGVTWCPARCKCFG